ncbi:predicted protein [Chaetoceros tenuissimus]|uniref:Uncharacterized protein n=1 Tax=Chaetoceros tenuissimus TaxID=426638 RepID=A0AAD3H836_9STRA|nr:predicted protein [Chaetoceros tenuissimus]
MKKGFLLSKEKKSSQRKTRPTNGVPNHVETSKDQKEIASVQSTLQKDSKQKESSWMKSGFLNHANKKQSKDSSTFEHIKKDTSERDSNITPKRDKARNDSFQSMKWNKGFLNSKKSKRVSSKKKDMTSSLKRKDIKTSSILLDLEKKDSDEQLEKGSTTILNMFHNEEQEKKPLIQSLDTEMETITFPSENDGDSPLLFNVATVEKEESWLKERSTKMNAKNALIQEVDTMRLADKKPFIREVDSSSNVLEMQSRETSTITSEDTDATDDDDGEKEEMPISSSLSLELSRLMKALKPKKSKVDLKLSYNDEIDLMKVFLEKYIQVDATHVKANIKFVWTSILDGIASYVKEKKILRLLDMNVDSYPLQSLPPLVRLACNLFYANPNCATDVLFQVLIYQPDSNEDVVKRKKLQQLGAFFAIKCHVVQMYKQGIDNLEKETGIEDKQYLKNSIEFIDSSLRSNLPSLLKECMHIQKDDMKRSLLAVNAFEAIYWLLEYASFLLNISSSKRSDKDMQEPLKKLASAIEGNLSLLLQITSTEKRWKEEAIAKKDDGLSSLYQDKLKIATCNDWIIALEAIKENSNLDKFVGLIQEETFFTHTATSMAYELAGIHLQQGDSKGGHCYGGIAHSLMDYNHLKMENYKTDTLNMIGAAVEMNNSALEDSRNDDIDERSTIILRQTCALLSSSKHRNHLTSADCKRASEFCIQLLKSKSRRSLKLTNAILNVVLFRKDGVPSDFHDLDGDCGKLEVPESFRYLVKEIRSSHNTDETLSPNEALSTICERLFLLKPEVLVPYFMSEMRYNALEVTILGNMIKDKNRHSKLTKGICLAIEEKLLTAFKSSKNVQKLAIDKEFTFAYIAIEKVITHLLRIQVENDSSSLVSTSAQTVLTKTITSRSETESSVIVTSLLKEFSSSTAVSKLCSKLRRDLLTSKRCSDSAYRVLLLSCGKELFRQPNNSDLLILLRSLIEGDDTSQHNSEERATSRILSAIMGLCHVCSSELERIDQDRSHGKPSIFTRLAPLLLLQQISLEHFRLVHSQPNKMNGVHDSVMSLASALSKRIQNQEEYTKEECKLSANIAAIYLPFSPSESTDFQIGCSSYEYFCEKTILYSSKAIERLQFENMEWGHLKAVLFIACRALQVSPNCMREDILGNFVKFCFHSIDCIGQDMQIYSNEMESIIAATLDFFAIGITAFYSPKVYQNVEKSNIHLIEIVKPNDDLGNKICDNKSNGSSHFLQHLQMDLLSIILGDLEALKLDLFKTSKFRSMQSISFRLTVLNVFSIVCQRCQLDLLEGISKSIAPTMIELALNQSILQAPSMQCLFFCFQRSQSFDAIEATQRKEVIRALFQMSMDIIDKQLRSSANIEKEETSILRLTSLKLITAIVTLDEKDNVLEKTLSPSDIKKWHTTLYGIANLDESEEMRELGSKLIASLSH